MVPRAVLMNSGLVSVNIARQNISKTAVSVNTARQVNTTHSKTIVNAARPISYLSKTAHSIVKRPIHKNITFKNSNINQRVNTSRPKAVVNADTGNNLNAGNPQMDLKDQRVIDSGCSRHMTGNMSYLTDYEEIDGGYVAFGGNPKGGKITGKCTIKTDDYSRFHGFFFRATEDETSGILKSFITGIENLVDHKVKAEAVNTACYVQNRVLVVKPHNKTTYELLAIFICFMRPFGCLVTILNTIDNLGKFDGKADEGFFVGYSLNSKSFRVFNSRTRIVEENLHIRFSESTPNVVQNTLIMEVKQKGDRTCQDYIFLFGFLCYIMGLLSTYPKNPKISHDDGSKPSSDDGKKDDEDPIKESECNDQEKEDNVNNTNNVNAIGTNEVNVVGAKTSIELPFDPNMPALEDDSICDFSRDDEDDGAAADMNNLDTPIQVSPIPTTRIHKDHHLDQWSRRFAITIQIEKDVKEVRRTMVCYTIQQRQTITMLQNCFCLLFITDEPKKVFMHWNGSKLDQRLCKKGASSTIQVTRVDSRDLPNGIKGYRL
ncbi:ribonuclease H-like domain-containing protein [Tanacetum coccineum]